MILKIDALHPDPQVIQNIVERLREGQVGVLPTETVYGLAALMRVPQAIARIYQIKERDRRKSLGVAISEFGAVNKLAEDVSDAAQELMETFWPGPLTLVFMAREELPGYITGGTGTIGIRMPDHEVTRAVLEGLREPLALTSANMSGEKAAYTVDRLGLQGMDFVVNAGETDLRRESTVVDVTQSPPQVLRKGVIDADRLMQFGVMV